MSRLMLSVLVLALPAGTVACTSPLIMNLGNMAYDIFSREDVNLLEKSYAAADFILERASGYINRDTVFGITELTDSEIKEISTPFGTTVSEQIGARFAQLGYKVVMDDLVDYPPEVARPALKPQVLLTGNYTVRRRDMTVRLRLVRIGSGQLIGSFDYTMPVTREVRELSEPRTRIYKP